MISVLVVPETVPEAVVLTASDPDVLTEPTWCEDGSCFYVGNSW